MNGLTPDSQRDPSENLASALVDTPPSGTAQDPSSKAENAANTGETSPHSGTKPVGPPAGIGLSEVGADDNIESLTAMLERFDAGAALMPGTIYLCDAKPPFQARFVGRRCEDILGFGPEAFIRSQGVWTSRIHPEDRNLMRHHLTAAITDGQSVSEYRFQHADGSYRWIRDQVTRIQKPDGETIALMGFEADVTQERAERDQVQHERDLLESVLRNTTVAVAVLSPEGKILFQNQHALNMRSTVPPGEVPPAFHWDGRPMADEDRPYQRVINSGKPICNAPVAVEPVVGERRLYLANGDPIFDEQGGLERVVMSMHDVTEGQRSAQALRVSEERYRQMVEQQTDLVCRYDAAGRMTFANPACCVAMDREAAELIGEVFPCLPKRLPTQEQPTVNSEFSLRVGDRDARRIQWVHRLLDVPADSQDLREYQAVGRDVTQIRDAQRQSRVARERLELVMSASPAIFFACEPKPLDEIAPVRFVSGRCNEMTGFSPEELLESPTRLHELLVLDPSRSQDALNYGPGHDSYSIPFRHRSGEERWMRIEQRTIWDDQGNAHEVVGWGVDVTAQKAQESALVESHDHYRQLAHRHERLLSELDHRVRNNLASLLGLIEIAGQRHGDPAALAREIRQRVHALSRVHNLLSDSGGHDLNLRQMVNGLLPMSLGTASLRISGPNVLLPAPIVQPLAMTLIELATNAAKHGAGHVPGGRLAIEWDVTSKEPMIVDPDFIGIRTLHLTWKELCGPTHPGHCCEFPSKPTLDSGLGTRLMSGFVEFELGGKLDLQYPDGCAEHKISFDLDRQPQPKPSGQDVLERL